MGASSERDDYGVVLFKPGTPKSTKVRGIFFFIVFCLIILVQAFYWVFANKVLPIVLGMPFGMFFIVLFIAIEFVALVFLYILESSEASEGGEV